MMWAWQSQAVAGGRTLEAEGSGATFIDALIVLLHQVGRQ